MAVSASEFLQWAIAFGIYPANGGGGGGLTPIAPGTFLANTGSSSAIPSANPIALLLTAAGNLGNIANAAQARANLDLESMALQAANAVDITGGSATLTSISAPFTYSDVPADEDLAIQDSLTAFVFPNSGVNLDDALGLSHYTDGFTFSLKNISGANCFFTPFSGEFIDGMSQLVIPAGAGFLITKDPTQWSIIANTASGGGTSALVPGTGSGSGKGGDGSSLATGNYSFSFGNSGNNSIGDNSFTFGTGNTSNGNWGLAFGNGCQANTYYSIAHGNISTVDVNGIHGFAKGYNCYVDAVYGVALGNACSVATNAYYGVAIGNGSHVINAGSYVLSDSIGSPQSDTANNQLVTNFNGGYRRYVGGNLVQAIDASYNSIMHYGQADQSYSYQVPSTGFTITPTAGVTILTLAPGATIASGTIDLSSLAPIDGQIFKVNAVDTVTALTLTGATVNNAPTTLNAGQGFELQYNLANTSWNVVYQTSNGGVSSTQVQRSAFNVGIDTGIADAYIVTLSPAVTTLTDGLLVTFTPINQNVTNSPTLQINALSPVLMVGVFGNSLSPNDLSPGIPAFAIYSIANGVFQLLNPQSMSLTGGGNTGALQSASSIATGAYSIALGENNTIYAGSSNSLALGIANVVNAGSTNCVAIGYGCVVQIGVNNAWSLGSSSLVQNSGSLVWTDSSGIGYSDTVSNQYVLNFSGGYNWNTGGTAIMSIDTNSNFITSKGRADQSYSLQVPATGFSIAMAINSDSLILNPAGTLATGTVLLPYPAIDGQEVEIRTSQIITSLSITGGGGSDALAVPFASTLNAGQTQTYKYNLANALWF